MSAHAVLAPSAAARWVACPGSVTLEMMYPETEESPESKEGTAAHWAASERLCNVPVAVGQVAPNGVVLTDEMIEGAELYDGAVNRSGGFNIETRIDIPYVHPTESWGTPDAWAFEHYPTSGKATLRVYDYKFGHGFVEVFENYQLIDYACGILDHLKIDGHADQHIDVEFTLVQPRSYHRDGPVRTWKCKASDLRPYFNKLKYAADLALGPDPTCVVNRECKNCRGRHACEAYGRVSMDSLDMSTRSIPLELPPHAVGLELRAVQRAVSILKARVSGLEEQALSLIRSGVNVPFYKVEQGYGREAWAKPIEEVITLGQMMNVNVAKPDVLTPKQAIKAGLPAEIVAMYSHTPRGALKLVEVDDTVARKVFGK